LNKRKIDWDKIHHLLEQTDAAIKKGFSPDPEEKKKILRERAKLLAKRPDEPRAGESLEIVEFLIGQEHYGIETRLVRETLPLKDFTPVPGVPSFVFGLINVRGQIISVIDIRRFFDMPEKGLSDLNRVIVIHDERMEFGILADEILGVRAVPLDELQPSLPTLTGVREEYLKGVTAERVVILDAGKLLSDRRMIVHQQVET
jgi:purine-binding chemotaxis protein CheW